MLVVLSRTRARARSIIIVAGPVGIARFVSELLPVFGSLTMTCPRFSMIVIPFYTPILEKSSFFITLVFGMILA